jgi:hypothetical protein
LQAEKLRQRRNDVPEIPWYLPLCLLEGYPWVRVGCWLVVTDLKLSELLPSPPQPWALALTWPLDCDLELSTASTLGEHLEVSHLFYTHTFGLQASPRGTAGMGVTGWGEKKEGEVGGTEGVIG